MMVVFFVALLIAAVLFELWLGQRQISFVTRHRGAVPAAFANRVTLEEHQRACDYTVAKAKTGAIADILQGIVIGLMAYAGGFALLYRSVISITGGGYPGTLCLVGGFLLLSSLLDLPLDIYRTFVLEARFGFNRTTKRLYIIDKLKMLALATVIGSALIWIVDLAMRHTGASWWVWSWGIWAAFSIISVFAVKFIAPLFNKYEPLDAGLLRSRLEAVMSKTGFRSNGIFKVDGSRRSAHANAYFTGFGSTKRIVLFDTLIDKLDTDEIEAVIAHELGHFKHGHIRKRLGFIFAASFVVFAILGWLSGQSWFYEVFRLQPTAFDEMPVTILLLFMMLSPSVTGWFSGIFNFFSRRDEFQADAFASSQSDWHHLASALVKLQRDNASALAPDPIYSAIHHSHPTVAQRIARLEASAYAAAS
jgi:STE24 endopeptidase